MATVAGALGSDGVAGAGATAGPDVEDEPSAWPAAGSTACGCARRRGVVEPDAGAVLVVIEAEGVEAVPAAAGVGVVTADPAVGVVTADAGVGVVILALGAVVGIAAAKDVVGLGWSDELEPHPARARMAIAAAAGPAVDTRPQIA